MNRYEQFVDVKNPNRVMWGDSVEPDLSDWVNDQSDSSNTIIDEKNDISNPQFIEQVSAGFTAIDFSESRDSGTIDFSFYATDTSNAHHVQINDGGSNYVCYMKFNFDGNVDFIGATSSTDIQAYLADEWIHGKIIFIKNGSCTLTINGNLIATITGNNITATRMRLFQSSNADAYWDNFAFSWDGAKPLNGMVLNQFQDNMIEIDGTFYWCDVDGTDLKVYSTTGPYEDETLELTYAMGGAYTIENVASNKFDENVYFGVVNSNKDLMQIKRESGSWAGVTGITGADNITCIGIWNDVDNSKLYWVYARYASSGPYTFSGAIEFDGTQAYPLVYSEAVDMTQQLFHGVNYNKDFYFAYYDAIDGWRKVTYGGGSHDVALPNGCTVPTTWDLDAQYFYYNGEDIVMFTNEDFFLSLSGEEFTSYSSDPTNAHTVLREKSGYDDIIKYTIWDIKTWIQQKGGAIERIQEFSSDAACGYGQYFTTGNTFYRIEYIYLPLNRGRVTTEVMKADQAQIFSPKAPFTNEFLKVNDVTVRYDMDTFPTDFKKINYVPKEGVNQFDLSEWTDPGVDNFEIVAVIEDHLSPLYIKMDTGQNLILPFTTQTAGIIEFFSMVVSGSKRVLWQITDSSNNNVCYLDYQTDAQYDFVGATSSTNIDTFTNNVWYHIKIIFTRDGTCTLTVDGDLKATITGNNVDAEQILMNAGTIDAERYLDALWFSWEGGSASDNQKYVVRQRSPRPYDFKLLNDLPKTGVLQFETGFPDWTNSSGADCVVRLKDELDGHRNVMELDDQSVSNSAEMQYPVSLTHGSYSGKVRTTDATSGISRFGSPYDGAITNGFDFFLYSGKLQYYDGAYHDIVAVSDDTWYQYTVHFRCVGAPEHEGLAVGTWKITFNNIDYGPYNDRGSPTTIDRIIVQTDPTTGGYQLYIDALGLFWNGAQEGDILKYNDYNLMYQGRIQKSVNDFTEYAYEMRTGVEDDLNRKVDKSYVAQTVDYIVKDVVESYCNHIWIGRGTNKNVNEFTADQITGDAYGWTNADGASCESTYLSEKVLYNSYSGTYETFKNVLQQDDQNAATSANIFVENLSFTVFSCWIGNSDVTKNNYIQFYENGTRIGFITIDNTNIYWYDGGLQSLGHATTNDYVYHITLLFNATDDDVDIYINGVFDSTQSLQNNITTDIDKLIYNTSDGDSTYFGYKINPYIGDNLDQAMNTLSCISPLNTDTFTKNFKGTVKDVLKWAAQYGGFVSAFRPNYQLYLGAFTPNGQTLDETAEEYGFLEESFEEFNEQYSLVRIYGGYVDGAILVIEVIGEPNFGYWQDTFANITDETELAALAAQILADKNVTIIAANVSLIGVKTLPVGSTSLFTSSRRDITAEIYNIIRNEIDLRTSAQRIYMTDSYWLPNPTEGERQDDQILQNEQNIGAVEKTIHPTVTLISTFYNSWVNYGSPFLSAGYCKIGNMVFLQGMIKNGVVGSSAFILPLGYRPPSQVLVGIISNSSIGRVDITTAGVVSPVAPSNNAWVSLDGISFLV